MYSKQKAQNKNRKRQVVKYEKLPALISSKFGICLLWLTNAWDLCAVFVPPCANLAYS